MGDREEAEAEVNARGHAPAGDGRRRDYARETCADGPRRYFPKILSVRERTDGFPGKDSKPAPHLRITDTVGKVEPGHSVPHITFHLDLRGLAPIALAEFDAEAFMKNARESHAREILAKLAPHLS